jgi:Family of unknown function (DUF6412)
MLLWGFWALLNPAVLTEPTHLVVALAVVAAALVVVALRLPALRSPGAPAWRAFARRARTAPRPRLIDPDAAGRPRPRAPSVCPAAA